MSKQAPVEPLVSVIPAPEIGPDVFTNEIKPWSPGEGVRGIFGGFLISQAVRAAQLSTGPSFAVHALQSVFLKPGRSTSPIYYHVDRVSDGRTFATRIVRAMQYGTAIYIATVGLQHHSSSSPPPAVADLEHAVPPPDMDGKGPDDIPATSKVEMLQMIGYNAALTLFETLDPFDWRHLIEPATATKPPPAPHSFRLRSFVRSPPLSSSAGSALHLASLAFLTDEWLIAVVNLAHPSLLRPRLPVTIQSAEQMNTVRAPTVAVQASMHHNVLFHDPAVKADEWLISERHTSWAGDGLVLIEQRLWSLETGRLVLSCWQEGLVRLKDDSKL